MSYKILKTRIQDEHLFTTVAYEIDGKVVEVEVANFRPATEADVIQAIENRELSEQVKLVAVETIKEVAKEIEKLVEKEEVEEEEVIN